MLLEALAGHERQNAADGQETKYSPPVQIQHLG